MSLDTTAALFLYFWFGKQVLSNRYGGPAVEAVALCLWPLIVLSDFCP